MRLWILFEPPVLTGFFGHCSELLPCYCWVNAEVYASHEASDLVEGGSYCWMRVEIQAPVWSPLTPREEMGLFPASMDETPVCSLGLL